jgi:hypothetical protein
VLYISRSCREAFGSLPGRVRDIERRFGARFANETAAHADCLALPFEVQDSATGCSPSASARSWVA